MLELLQEFAQTIAGSRAHDAALYLLGQVPGFPPLVQTVHLLSVAIIMGSVMLLGLRVLGLAMPSQLPTEMAARLAPWTWSALPLLLASGLVFVLARPRRYLVNPMFGIKFALLLPALILTVMLYRSLTNGRFNAAPPRLVAGLALLAWVGVVLAGRWIAYADYLFATE